MGKNVKEFFAKSGDYVKDLNENVSSIFKKSDKKSIFKKDNFDFSTYEQVLKKLSSRRSCRKFSSKKVDLKVIYEIITASLKAPCAGGIENVSVVIISDEHKRHNLAKIHSEQTWAGEAPIMLAVICDTNELKSLYGFDYENLALQNATLVTGSIVNLVSLTDLECCIVRAGDDEKTSHELGVGDGMFVSCLIPVGYCDDIKPDFVRSPENEKIFFDSFGNHEPSGGGHH